MLAVKTILVSLVTGSNNWTLHSFFHQAFKRDPETDDKAGRPIELVFEDTDKAGRLSNRDLDLPSTCVFFGLPTHMNGQMRSARWVWDSISARDEGTLAVVDVTFDRSGKEEDLFRVAVSSWQGEQRFGQKDETKYNV